MRAQEKLQVIKSSTGYSQATLATKLGVSTQTLNSWINGKSEPRAKAKEKVDALYRTYIGDIRTEEDTLKEKKQKLHVLQEIYTKPFALIMSRKDLYDAFLLELTYHTNSIEGSTFNEPEVRAVLFDDVTIPKKSVIEHQEVKNHQAALGYIMRFIREKKPLTKEIILHTHQILMNGILHNAGQYRNHSVRIVGSSVTTANHASIDQKMNEFIALFNKKSKDILRHIAETHAHFEHIHPFSDGNGRIGRLLMLITVFQHGLAPVIIKKERKMAYYNYLEEAQISGNTHPLTSFMYDSLFEGYNLLAA